MINTSISKAINNYKTGFFQINYLFFSVFLVVGFATSEFIMSVASISLFINWLIEGNFKEKYLKAKSLYYIPCILILGYLSLFLWLINTSNFEYAFHDLKVKLPLLLFPLIYGTIVIKYSFLRIILRFFILGVTFSTLISFLVYIEFIPIDNDIADVRNISIFISHIRLSLLICFSIVLLIFFGLKKQMLFNSAITVFIIIWLTCFLVLLQVFTGILVLMSLCLIFLVQLLFTKSHRIYALISVVLFIVILTLFFIRVKDIYSNNFNVSPMVVSELDERSISGEVYQYRLEDNWAENGNRVWIYIAPKELKLGWEKRSEIPFDSLDLKGQPMWGTLYRYLTSRGLRKDKEGLEQLTTEEIKLIELGQTNCCEKLTGLDRRIKDVFFQYQRYQNGQSPNGHSIIQRVEYLKSSVSIISENFLFGVGLGDVHDEFMMFYEKNNSKLLGKNRKRVHNQYMVFAVGLGVFGLILWMFLIYYPVFKNDNNKILYAYFIIIISISFLTDNTLERQAGVMFFSFFNSLLLFQKISQK